MPKHQRSKTRAGFAGLAAVGLAASLASIATNATAATTAAPTAVPPAVGAVQIAQSAAAKAKTPNTAKLAGALAKQKLTWEKCDYLDPKINARFADLPNVKCATVKVPRDWHNPDANDTIDIRISQATNIEVGNARYKGTIFVNPGGPGGPGLPWAAAMTTRAHDLVPYYNFVGFDPRGVAQSEVPACPVTYDENSADPYEIHKAIARSCSTHKYASVINTEQTTYDMDFIRHMIKVPKLSYIGYSYGTWLGTWYENVFAANADKFLLDSAIDVTQPTMQRTWEIQPIARDRQFQTHLMNWIARHNDIYKLGTDPKRIYERYFEGAGNMSPFMLQLFWGFADGFRAFPDNSFYPDAASVVSTISDWAESPVNARRATPATPAQQTDELLARLEKSPTASASLKAKAAKARKELAPLKSLALKGDAGKVAPSAARAAGITASEDDEPLPPNYVTEDFNEPFDMVRCNDGQWTQGAAYWEALGEKTNKKAPFSAQFGLADSVPICAFWRTNVMMPAVNPATFPKTMVIQGELDSQTAYETGYTTGTKLPHTKLTIIDNEGSHGHFPYGTECVDRRIYNYFLTGKLTGKNVQVCQALPLIQDTATYETWTKMTANGKPGTPVYGPTVPVDTKGKAAKASGAPLEIVDPQVKARTEQVIREAYGQEGVAAAKKSGLLR